MTKARMSLAAVGLLDIAEQLAERKIGLLDRDPSRSEPSTLSASA